MDGGVSSVERRDFALHFGLCNDQSSATHVRRFALRKIARLSAETCDDYRHASLCVCILAHSRIEI